MRSFLATLFASAALAVRIKDTAADPAAATAAAIDGGLATAAPLVAEVDTGDAGQALPICTGDDAVDTAGCIADTVMEDTAALPICTGDAAMDAAGCLPDVADDVDGEIQDALEYAASAVTADTAETALAQKGRQRVRVKPPGLAEKGRQRVRVKPTLA